MSILTISYWIKKSGIVGLESDSLMLLHYVDWPLFVMVYVFSIFGHPLFGCIR